LKTATREKEQDVVDAQTVLIVDDESDLRVALSEYLRSKGLKVLETGDGLDALVQVKRTRPSAIVLDLMLPRLGGIEALKRVRAIDPGIAIHVITGVDDPELWRQARLGGATTVFRKPFDFDELLAAVNGSRLEDNAPPAEAKRAPGASPRSPVTSSKGQILVVDDEEEVCSLLAEYLPKQGYVVRVALNGATAVREVVNQAPDVVLLDLNMPVLGGIEALATIRALAPRTKVIMLSGQSDLDRAKESIAAGAFDYITKPFGLVYLTQTIETALLADELAN